VLGVCDNPQGQVALFREYLEQDHPLTVAQLFSIEQGRIARMRLVFAS
jgi:hypothetical protein